MSLRDHFRPSTGTRRSWEGVHGGWPMVIVQRLSALLPADYVAEPRVHLGSAFEIDVAAFEEHGEPSWAPVAGGDNGGVAVATWAPAQAAVLLDAEVPMPSEYEVLVYDETRQHRLVAAVELVSPGNKDRPENRRAFVHECAALLHQGVCVVVVDIVTIRTANLYRELAESIGAAAPALRTPIYAVACRSLRREDRWRVEAWEHELVVGQSLPTLPLWLSEQLYVPLELEKTYEDTCRALRIG